MNIFNLCQNAINSASLFQEPLFLKLSPKQKRITLIAVSILSYWVVCLAILRCYQSRNVKHVEDPQKVEKKIEELVIKNEQPQDYNVEKDAAPIDNLGEIKVEEKIDDECRTMPIFLETASGMISSFEVSPLDKISRFKQMIEDSEGIPTYDITLVSAGSELSNDKTFADYNIKNGNTIQMIVRFRPENEFRTMKIFVESWMGRKRTFKVSSSDKILELKKMIQNRDGHIPPDQCKLVFAGRLLENDRTLDDYLIQKESTIHIILRLRGD